MNHHTEAFIEDGTHRIGWQCFTCGTERAGFASIAAAESDADRHQQDPL